MNTNHIRTGAGIVAALGGSLLILTPLNVDARNVDAYVNRVCPGTEIDDCVPQQSAGSRGDAAGGGSRPGRVTVDPSSSTRTVGSDRHLENLAADVAARYEAQQSAFPTIGDLLAADAAQYVEQAQPTLGSDRHLENLAADIEARYEQQSTATVGSDRHLENLAADIEARYEARVGGVPGCNGHVGPVPVRCP